MKKVCLALFVVLSFTSVLFQAASAESNLKPAALKKFQNEVVKTLPVESDIVRLAILDFEGDDGTIKNAVTSAITEKTTFKVIERADLDKILAEQGLQLKDIMDEKTRITHGKIKGVQGLLMGKVLGMQEGFMSYNIKVHLKLDDVEKGEIVVSKDISVPAVSPVRKWITIAGALILAFILLQIFLGMRRVKKHKEAIEEKTTIVKEDMQARVDLTKEIRKALTSISDAKSKLMDKGKTDEAVMIKDAEKEMLLLKEQVDNAPRGRIDVRTPEEHRKILEFDQKIISTFEGLTTSANRLYDTVLSGNTGNFQREIDVLKRDIKNAMNDFSSRGY